MTDLRSTITPKSNQLNADDLIGRSITAKITKVSKINGDQPIAINFEDDGGKPYMPCKSMRRVLVSAWGDKGQMYVGKTMVLYRDEKVKWAGAEVGGIRISHLSDIDSDMTIILTESQKNRKPYTVKKFVLNAPKIDIDKLRLSGLEAAQKGHDAFLAWYNGQEAKSCRNELKPYMAEFQSETEKAAKKAPEESQ